MCNAVINPQNQSLKIIIGYWTNTVFWDRVLWSEFDHRACEVINPTKERGPQTLYEFNNRIIIYKAAYTGYMRDVTTMQ